jgi:hypothetical protein
MPWVILKVYATSARGQQENTLTAELTVGLSKGIYSNCWWKFAEIGQ